MNIWVQFKEIIFNLLLFLQGVLGNWGLAIIALTILFRLALMPLTIKQTRSMYEMQRIQPKLKELQVKYKDDKEKLQEETMKFYQEHKVNPFGGCLPLILQMPIFIALYQVLGFAGRKPGLMLQYLASHPGESARFFFILPDIVRAQRVAAAAAHARRAPAEDDRHLHGGLVPLLRMGQPRWGAALLGHLELHRRRATADPDEVDEAACRPPRRSGSAGEGRREGRKGHRTRQDTA
jgi:YidC/Oxa1 family membrane protein insertase